MVKRRKNASTEEEEEGGEEKEEKAEKEEGEHVYVWAERREAGHGPEVPNPLGVVEGANFSAKHVALGFEDAAVERAAQAEGPREDCGAFPRPQALGGHRRVRFEEVGKWRQADAVHGAGAGVALVHARVHPADLLREAERADEVVYAGVDGERHVAVRQRLSGGAEATLVVRRWPARSRRD